MATTVVSIRIPRELRERMKRVPVNWSEEIRRFIEETVERYEMLNVIREIRRRAKTRKVRVDSTSLIREDREGH